ncbi:MAG: hypothetical protein WB643_09265 [Candidatus Bathyarchaeia archaeon]
MHKKLAAALTITIFVISTLAIVGPVQAHFTLGNLTGTYRYHANDFDPHVAGPIGYVWPGGGQGAYQGALNFASSSQAPGYQSPYPGGNPVGAPSNSWYQLESDAYAPFGAVLTGSTGDLIFGLNATCPPTLWGVGCAANAPKGGEIQSPLSDTKGWDTWMILIPPEFKVPGAAALDSSQIASTLTNSYDKYLVATLGPNDRYAPGWTLVAIGVDAAVNPGYNHQYLNFTTAGEWYYARINGVVAPTTAGRYFFKMFLYSAGSSGNYYGVGPSLAGSDGDYENPDVWVPPQNWPVMLVKGEVDPAIITGTLRYAGYNASLYGLPIEEAGKVWAKMTTRLDPYTGAQRPDLPTVDAQAYVNATATGHYELEGLAPGIYDLYASAAGYPQTLCASGITILKGQSLHFDCYLQPGPVIHGQVFTKHQFGDEPWPGNSTTGSYIKIELYDSPTLANLPDPSANLVSWSPLPCVAGGQEMYYGRRAAGLCGDPRDGSAIAFPWHEYSTDFNVVAQPPVGGFAPGYANGYSRDVAITDVLGSALLTSDPQGVGPPQKWFVQGGTTTPFHYEFGLKGEYGAPRDFNGEVPQVYATWINGLTPGRYYVRAWVFRYVQTALDGATFQEYSFDITPNEWAGDVSTPLDLRLSSWINKTVYFHNTVNTIMTGPITTGAGYIWGNLVGADGSVYAHNVTNLGYDDEYYGCNYDTYSYDTGGEAFNDYTSAYTGVIYYGSGETGAPSHVCPGESNFLNKAHTNADSLASGKANIQFWGFNDTWGGENYGIPSGTYTPNIGVNGYYEQSPQEQVSVTLSGSTTFISDHLFRAPGFNVTVTSIDWERPRVSRPWVWGGCQDAGGAQFNMNLQPLAICAGSEIDIGWYPVVNGTAGALADYLGDEPSFLPPSLGFGLTGLYQGGYSTNEIPCPFQGTGVPDNSTCAEADGGGRNVLGGISGGTSLAHDAFFGQSARYAFVGGYTSGSFGWLRATKLWRNSMFTALITVWPMHFNEGQYNLRAYTYGYVQDKDFTAYALNGQVADMKINLLIGVNITLDVLFKKESIITGTDNNMSARVRLFDDSGQLVATWMSSEGVYVTNSTTAPANEAIAANGVLTPNAGTSPYVDGNGNYEPNALYPFIYSGVIQTPSSGLKAYNYLPANTTLLHVLMAGLPQQPPGGTYLVGVYYSDPVFTPSACDFELDCYPGAYGQYPFANTGILGAPDYTGGWTAEVDFVNWYGNNTHTFPVTGYYPPVQGLLMGESYHIIPGTTATSGISFTEDAATGPTFVGHTMAPNHLGPYSQQGVWQISNAHLSGEASAIFEVDLNGLVSGNALAFTWSNEFRPLSWGLVNVVGANGASWNFYTYDGIYEVYLPPGTYKFTISSPGYAAQTFSVVVSPGQSGVGQNMYLEQSNIPVPEFSAIGIVAFSALAASLYLLRRRRR